MSILTHDEISQVLGAFEDCDIVNLNNCSIERSVIDLAEQAGVIQVHDIDIGMAFFSEMQLTERGRGLLGRTLLRNERATKMPRFFSAS